MKREASTSLIKLTAKILFIAIGLAAMSGMAFAQQLPAYPPEAFSPPPEPRFVQVIPHVDAGFLAVLSHEYQSGSSGTLINFLTQGGQDTLVPYERYSIDLVLGGANRISFLYQPLTVATKTVVDKNGSSSGDPIVVDGVVFPVGTPLDIIYGFDFWRLSYLYDFAKDPDTILAAGLSLQVRNASISFSSADGSLRAIQQNIGPVPILKVRAARWFTPEFALDFEADGFYASSAFFNGSGKAFKGWIWDSSLSAKTRFLPGSTAFLTVRSIGGGAEGNNAYGYSSSTTSTPGGYTYNALATLALTLGMSIAE